MKTFFTILLSLIGTILCDAQELPVGIWSMQPQGVEEVQKYVVEFEMFADSIHITRYKFDRNQKPKEVKLITLSYAAKPIIAHGNVYLITLGGATDESIHSLIKPTSSATYDSSSYGLLVLSSMRNSTSFIYSDLYGDKSWRDIDSVSRFVEKDKATHFGPIFFSESEYKRIEALPPIDSITLEDYRTFLRKMNTTLSGLQSYKLSTNAKLVHKLSGYLMRFLFPSMIIETGYNPRGGEKITWSERYRKDKVVMELTKKMRDKFTALLSIE